MASAAARSRPAGAEAPCTLEGLYRAHALSIARWASRLGGPNIDCEDVLQDVFIVVQRQLPRFRGESNVTTWLFGITRNVVRARRERDRVRRLFQASFGLLWDRPPNPDAPQAERLEQRQELELVYRALDALAEPYRTAFVLFEIEGLTGEEAAELTGTNVNTLRVHLMRGRAKFLQRMTRLLERRPRRT